ncbi:MAG: hypothetical protein ACLUD0_15785 [Eubacterium ramulus]
MARSSNEYGAELMKKYPEQIGVLASLPLPEIDAAVEEVKVLLERAACDRICSYRPIPADCIWGMRDWIR